MKQGRWILGVLLVCLAACSGQTEPAPLTDPTTLPTTLPTIEPSTAATTTVETSVTTVPPTTSTTVHPEPLDLTHPDAPAPDVNLEADTWAELLLVWDELDDYWVWLAAHPTEDPTLVGAIFHPEGPEFTIQLEGMRENLADGWRVITESIYGEVIGFGCCPDPDLQMQSGMIEITVTARSDDPTTRIVDADGVLVAQGEAYLRQQFTVELRQDEDGRWLVWRF